MDIDKFTLAQSVEEPLFRLARFAYDWAPSLCDPAKGCRDYHRAWSLIRLLELDGRQPLGFDQITDELRALSKNGHIRVLISGAADTGLAAFVINALRPKGIEPEIVLVDCCLTTIEQNRLFAHHAQFALETHQKSVADVDVAPVDAVIASSFMGFIAPSSRQAVVDAWARNLKGGGKVFYLGRLRETTSQTRTLPNHEVISAKRHSLEENALRTGFSELEAKAISATAAGLWVYPIPHEYPLVADFSESLRNAGLVVSTQQEYYLKSMVSPVVYGEKTPNVTTKLVVATRPERGLMPEGA
jgi:hypothetical protein